MGVVGGGPAGSLFAYFLLQLAKRAGLSVDVDVFEPRDFSRSGPAGCNMCGGIVSESLVQSLATEGIHLPVTVLQRRIDSYSLHMDAGSVRIETPLEEKRIAAVHRGGGPRTVKVEVASFDGYLLSLAAEQGAVVHRDRVDSVVRDEDGVRIGTRGGLQRRYDLLAVATGVNTSALKMFEGLGTGYAPPATSRAWVSEYPLGLEMTTRYFGSSMHVFLLDLPRLDFAALIPKQSYVTLCLLGQNIDRPLVEAFLSSPEVRRCMPPHWRLPADFCHCTPMLSVGSAVKPYADRLVFVGDCGTTRLYKDGIGAAFRAAKAAAVTAVFEGISREDFRRHYWPICRSISADNRLGRTVFFITRQIQRHRFARRALWRMVADEQKKRGLERRMSGVLWDTFTGSAPYRNVFLRSLHPVFLGRFLWSAFAANWPVHRNRRDRRTAMASSEMGRTYRDGEVIFRQGEAGDCVYAIARGQVELIQRKDDKEFCIALLGQGDILGETALFGEPLRSTTARASGSATVLTIEKKAFLRRLHEEPSLAFKLLSRMSHRVQDLEESLVRMRETP